MDIKSKAVPETGRLHLKDAHGNLLFDGESAVVAVLYSPASKQYQAALAARSNKVMARMRKGKTGELTPEQQAKDNAEYLASITHSFEHMSYDGKPATTREVCELIYSDITIGFIADQVAAHVGEWANF